MATLSEKSLHLKTLVLMANGTPYGEKLYAPLVISKTPGGVLFPTEHGAHKLDAGAIRESFDTTADANALRAAFQNGKNIINSFRHIDPAAIEITELALDVFAVDFTDEEQEILTVIGALDEMKYGDKTIVKQAFPILKTMQIAAHAEPAWNTRDGNVPHIEDSRYKLLSASARDTFNTIASDPVYLEKSAVARQKTKLEVLDEDLDLGCVLYHNLTGIAEEVGKARLGLLDEPEKTIFYLRLYETTKTYVPTPPPPPRDIRQEAMSIIMRQKPEAARAIVDALRMRMP